MIKYAIISDIHGNLEALKAVQADLEKSNVDRIICLGDIISKGAHGHECIEIVKTMCDASLRGNNDIRYTRSLPMCCEFMLSGRLVRCFHASPNDCNKSIFNFDDYKEKFELFNPSEFTTDKTADVVVYGHTHHMGMEKMFGRLLVNAGSVGNSLNLITDPYYNAINTSAFTEAEYVILAGEDGEAVGDISVEFRTVKYDKNKELDSYSLRGIKADQYKNEIIFGEYRHPERIMHK